MLEVGEKTTVAKHIGKGAPERRSQQPAPSAAVSARASTVAGGAPLTPPPPSGMPSLGAGRGSSYV